MSRKKLYSLCTCGFLLWEEKKGEELENHAIVLSLPCTETYHHGVAR